MQPAERRGTRGRFQFTVSNIMTLQADHKKRSEQNYVEEARHASKLFPAGTLVPYEKPDFLLHADGGRTIGIELTELCRETPRALAGRLTKIPARAKEQYNQMPGISPVDVSIAFWREENISVNDLTRTLAKFVHLHRLDLGTNFTDDLPPGFCCIGIHEPLTAEGRWQSNRAFDVTATPKELLDACIADKTARTAVYRMAAPEAWLLIVNDHFLGPGEVRTDPAALAQWTFSFAFDKVLLFLRQAGGRGEVINLRRA